MWCWMLRGSFFPFFLFRLFFICIPAIMKNNDALLVKHQSLFFLSHFFILFRFNFLRPFYKNKTNLKCHARYCFLVLNITWAVAFFSDFQQTLLSFHRYLIFSITFTLIFLSSSLFFYAHSHTLSFIFFSLFFLRSFLSFNTIKFSVNFLTSKTSSIFLTRGGTPN